MQTVTEWLMSNNFYEQAILLDINGNEHNYWVENDPKYDAHVISVEPMYPEEPWICAFLHTDYVSSPSETFSRMYDGWINNLVEIATKCK